MNRSRPSNRAIIRAAEHITASTQKLAALWIQMGTNQRSSWGVLTACERRRSMDAIRIRGGVGAATGPQTEANFLGGIPHGLEATAYAARPEGIFKVTAGTCESQIAIHNGGMHDSGTVRVEEANESGSLVHANPAGCDNDITYGGVDGTGQNGRNARYGPPEYVENRDLSNRWLPLTWMAAHRLQVEVIGMITGDAIEPLVKLRF